MNNRYYYRIFTLCDLGIDTNENISEIYKSFKNIVGNREDIIVRNDLHEAYNLYEINGKFIFAYDVYYEKSIRIKVSYIRASIIQDLINIYPEKFTEESLTNSIKVLISYYIGIDIDMWLMKSVGNSFIEETLNG